MTPVLNLVTKVKDVETLPSFETEKRSLVFYLSHKQDVVILGYINEFLVFFGMTKTEDILSVRRSYDCIKSGGFFNTTSLENMLNFVNYKPCDLEDMAQVLIDDMTADTPVWAGCFIPQRKDANMSSIMFAEYMAVLPQRLKASIATIGSNDDIIAELESDYEILQNLYAEDETYNFDKYQKAIKISNKWSNVGCLHLSERASIRFLYRRILFHESLTITY